MSQEEKRNVHNMRKRDLNTCCSCSLMRFVRASHMSDFIDKSLTAFKNIVLIDLLFPFNTHTNISTLYHCTLYSTNRPSFFCCTFVWFRMQTHAAFMHQSRLSLSLFFWTFYLWPFFLSFLLFQFSMVYYNAIQSCIL